MQGSSDPKTALNEEHSTASRWATHTWELLAGYCADVHDRDPRDCPFDEQVVLQAGWEVLRSSEGNPCWSKLNVHELLERVAGGTEADRPLRYSIVLTLMTFYCFLVKHGHLSRDQASDVVDQLAPLWDKACSWVMAQLVAPASPSPVQRRPAEAKPN